ncbi:MAG TPA: AgmX/PglI C-terminal domain-containing protein [Anaeromyxobacteraceae bacterium]|nr:AgmX/PglI C-terminal domain-containing protein [Anaeromyxobacteraceae bacterium]
MRFSCPKCGKKYTTADEPEPGRVYSLTCRCGNKVALRAEQARSRDAAEPTPPPSAPRGSDPFPSERRRTAGGTPVSSIDVGSRSGEPTPTASWSASQTQRVPLGETTPALSQARTASPASHAPPAPAARPALVAPEAPAPSPDPFAAFAASQAASPAAPGAAPLDPFADLPDLQAEARGEARPLTTVPEINGPVPEPPPGFDPFAAQQGLLLDQREARSIAGGAPVPAPPAGPVAEAPEPAINPAEPMPVPPALRARAVVPRVASRGRGRLALALASVAVVGVGAAAAWFFLGRTRPSAPAQAVARPAPPPAAPLGSPPIPAPLPTATAAPAPAAIPAAAATPSPPAAAAPGPAKPPPAEARPEPRREPPRKAEPRRAQRQVAAAATAAEAAPHREPERADPPPKPDEPEKKLEDPKVAPEKSAPAVVANKQDTGPVAPPGGSTRSELTSAEVGASIKASANAFDACVAEAVRNEPKLQVLGRRVGLYITVNPSGAVTEPRLDDAEVEDSVLGACLKATARKMAFPAFQGEAFQVRIPMVLGAGR